MSSHLRAVATLAEPEPDGSAGVLQMLREGRHPKRVYPPRRPWNGHYPDCPKPEDSRASCRFCRSEELSPA